MKCAYILGLAAALLFFVERGSAQSPFYSADEYQLGHSVFDQLSADLQTAQASTSARQNSQARAEVGALERNWDNGVYSSRQMDLAIEGLRTLIDNSASLRDRANLDTDLSRLLDLRKEYY
jgi:hypothetical protein